MSKSAGEFLRLQLLIDKGYHPLAYRLMCLQAHYRSELEFSWEGLRAALVRLKRMALSADRMLIEDERWHEHRGSPKEALAEGNSESRLRPLIERFDAAISDDLNTPIALTAFEEVLASKDVYPSTRIDVALKMEQVLGLDLLQNDREILRVRPASSNITEPEIEAILARRKEARVAKDFATSDRLRDELAAQGVEVMDGDPLGWDWKLG